MAYLVNDTRHEAILVQPYTEKMKHDVWNKVKNNYTWNIRNDVISFYPQLTQEKFDSVNVINIGKSDEELVSDDEESVSDDEFSSIKVYDDSLTRAELEAMTKKELVERASDLNEEAKQKTCPKIPYSKLTKDDLAIVISICSHVGSEKAIVDLRKNYTKKQLLEKLTKLHKLAIAKRSCAQNARKMKKSVLVNAILDCQVLVN